MEPCADVWRLSGDTRVLNIVAVKEPRASYSEAVGVNLLLSRPPLCCFTASPPARGSRLQGSATAHEQAGVPVPPRDRAQDQLPQTDQPHSMNR
ncbi:hypothetical protein EYF80_012900 [Liparis tanakae]|uniref:Uncharacterized protein n=1 Tax=Liparis tanakae TaxID=230148 RepID=A0A4Z2IGD6_9TELE|nr:hypothetical protein EYF80_012900 [Liparis tanakae]